MKTSQLVILVNLLLLLGVIGFEISKKEKTLAEGKLILLELAPKDPRSLMQGDYMVLRYAETRSIRADSIPSRGYCILKLDENGVGKRQRFQEKAEPLYEGEYRVKYFHSDWFASIGAESYFFEEGTAQLFEKAKYGGLRVAKSGESLLVGLYDENREFIEPKSAIELEIPDEILE